MTGIGSDAWSSPADAIVVSGVAGSGKSTIGSLLAARLGRPFLDADDLHPRANVEKMSAGVPLTDDDRWPWLDAVGRAAQESGAVVACSALRADYRSRLRRWTPGVVFVQLSAGRDLIEARLSRRQNHFMPTSLLASQFALLEPLGDDEAGMVAEVDAPPPVVVESIVQALARDRHDRSSAAIEDH